MAETPAQLKVEGHGGSRGRAEVSKPKKLVIRRPGLWVTVPTPLVEEPLSTPCPPRLSRSRYSVSRLWAPYFPLLTWDRQSPTPLCTAVLHYSFSLLVRARLAGVSALGFLGRRIVHIRGGLRPLRYQGRCSLS